MIAWNGCILFVLCCEYCDLCDIRFNIVEFINPFFNMVLMSAFFLMKWITFDDLFVLNCFVFWSGSLVEWWPIIIIIIWSTQITTLVNVYSTIHILVLIYIWPKHNTSKQ